MVDANTAPDATSTTTSVRPANTRPRPSRARNWWFILLATNLYICSALYIVMGTLQVLLGANALNVLGGILSRDCTEDSLFNSLWRFNSFMWAAYGIFFVVFCRDFPRFAPVVYTFAVVLFLGGLVRVWNTYIYDIPGPPMGYFVVYIAMFHELSNPLLISLLLYLGLRLEKKRA